MMKRFLKKKVKVVTSRSYRLFICFILFASILIACGQNPEEELVKASDVLADGNYNKALSEYQKIAQKYEDNSEAKAKAMYWIGNINLLYLNNLQTAIVDFENFVLEFPTHPLALDASWKIAVAYQDDFKDGKTAILKYQRLIDHFPNTPEAARAQLAIANCYTQCGDTQQALIEARFLLNNYPTSAICPKALLFIGDNQYQCGNLKVAKESYQELIKKYPATQTAIDAWFALGQTQEDLRDYKAALESFKQIETSYYNQDLIKRRIKRLESLMGRDKKPKRRSKSMKW